MKKLFIILLLAMPAFDGIAQNISVRAGKSNLVYDDRFFDELFVGTPQVATIDVKLGFQDRGGSPYASWYKDPEYGIAFAADIFDFCKFQPGSRVSNIYSLYGYFDRPIIWTGKFYLGYSFGVGLAYTSDVFDPVGNHYNQFFSTNVFAHAAMGFEARYALSPKYELGLGAYFNHSSNGTVRMPNFGINALEYCMTVKRLYQPRKPVVCKKDRPVTDWKKGFIYDVHAGMGVVYPNRYKRFYSEEYAWEEQRFKFRTMPRFTMNFDVLYRWHQGNASGIGLDLFWMTSSKILYELDEYKAVGSATWEECPYNPFSYGLSLQHEVFYRNFGFHMYYGWTLYKNTGWNDDERSYQGLNIRYYFPQFKNTFVGIMLVATKFSKAECVQYCIGKRF